MFLVAIVLMSALAVPLFGGRLSALADVRARLAWILMLALGLQVVALTVPGVPESLRPLIQLASYPIAGVFVIANRHLPGMLLIGLGVIIAVHGLSGSRLRVFRQPGRHLRRRRYRGRHERAPRGRDPAH